MALRFRDGSRLLAALALALACYGELGCESTAGLTGGTSAHEAGVNVRPDARVDGGSGRNDAGDDAVDASVVDSTRSEARTDAVSVAATGAVGVSSPSQLLTFCAVTESGDVECWGENEFGQVGDGTTTFRGSPTKVHGLSGPASEVVVAGAFVCALLRSGSVQCWGYDVHGELGNGEKQDHSVTPVTVKGLEGEAIALSAGYLTTCAIKKGGTVWCWGQGAEDILGSGSTADTAVPTQVSGIDDGATAIAVGYTFACALRNGGVLCWGADDGLGELGNGASSGSSSPVTAKGLNEGVQSITAGSDFACALSAAGAVSCWGDGAIGELGNGAPASSPTPVVVTGLPSGVRAIAAGYDSACAIEADGSIDCWGGDSLGELGVGGAPFAGGNLFTATPVHVKGLTKPAVALSIGVAPCAVLANGGLECWGVTAEQAIVPVSVSSYGLANGAVHVSVGGDENLQGFACATNAGGALSCWGANGRGQLGDELDTPSALPVVNTDLVNGTTSLSAGNEGNFACAVNSGEVYCWGANDYGQLGNGSLTSSGDPVPVSNLKDAVAVSAGSVAACALTSAGAVYCWGHNSFGELGNSTYTSSKVPVAVPKLASGVLAISVGADFACAILGDQTVACWGTNPYGQLGNGTLDTAPEPVPVTALTSVTSLGVGRDSACAVTQGYVECWGSNDAYQLGSGTVASSRVPIRVSDIESGATQVSVGAVDACAIVNGGVRCWGAPNTLGAGTSFYSGVGAVPVTGIDSGATDLSLGATAACAVVNDGIQCWGLNYAGELGNGGAVDALIATPVAGFP